MHKEVKKVDKKFFQTRGASENALFRKRNFLATDEDEVSIAFVDVIGHVPRHFLFRCCYDYFSTSLRGVLETLFVPSFHILHVDAGLINFK
jgi:hypothetical protein